MLIGDAAGFRLCAERRSIRPAIESGMMAATAILNARGLYSRDRLAPYETALGARFGSSTRPRSSALPASLTSALAVGLMRVPAFVRHVVLDRWFLRSGEPALLH
jgi:flavin-dependent dehydrogenase